MIRLVIATAVLTWAPLLQGVDQEPVFERVKLNWATMRIQFYGLSQDQLAYPEAEKKAIKEGLAYIVKALPEIRESVLSPQQFGPLNSKQVAMKVSQSTYSSLTTYFSSGGVKVTLESSLPKALAPGGLTFSKAEARSTQTKNTGILVQLTKAMEPQMIYQIVDQNGNVLYQLDDVAERDFYKNFMGRFYQTKNSSQLNYFLGRNRVEITGELKGDNTIVVDGSHWHSLIQGNYGILERSKLGIIQL